MPDDIRNMTLDEIMGWTLNATEEWKPATIGNIDTLGSVHVWNTDNPDELVLEGDELLTIDTIVTFHNNASTFMSRLNQHFKNAQSVKAAKRSLLLHIQRPRPVQDAFDREHPVEEVEEIMSRQRHEVHLPFDAVQQDESGTKRELDESGAKLDLSKLLVWDLDEGGAIRVKNLHQEGLLTRWNAMHPDQQILLGDEIVAVNGNSMENYASTMQFAETVWDELIFAGRPGPEAAPVRLSLLRPVWLKRHVRQNMENGVHMDCVGCTTTTPEPPPFVEGMYDAVASRVQDSGHKPDRYGAADDDVVGATEG